jgi:hypothetical protein
MMLLRSNYVSAIGSTCMCRLLPLRETVYAAHNLSSRTRHRDRQSAGTDFLSLQSSVIPAHNAIKCIPSKHLVYVRSIFRNVRHSIVDTLALFFLSPGRQDL